MNLCVWSDGYVDDLRVGSQYELQEKITSVLREYNAENQLTSLKELANHSISEQQFAQILGKMRLYHHLPKEEKARVPLMQFNDNHISTIAKDYYEDESFCRNEQGQINLWDVYNLLTQANKSSYIDSYLSRNVNAFDFTDGIRKALIGSGDYHWFLG